MSIDSIDSLIQSLKDDYVNGSTTIAKKSLQILLSAWNLYGIRNRNSLVAYAHTLKASKPTMAAVQNILRILQSRLMSSDVSMFPAICTDLL